MNAAKTTYLLWTLQRDLDLNNKRILELRNKQNEMDIQIQRIEKDNALLKHGIASYRKM